MKAAILLAFSLLIITESLIGQINRFNQINKDLKKDKDPSNSFYHFRKIDFNFNLHNYNDLPAVIKSQRPIISHDSLFHDYSKNRRSEDFVIVEEYPGSSIFYAKSYVKPYTYEKSFIIKPDTTVKYYLIIKDPILHKIIN